MGEKALSTIDRMRQRLAGAGDNGDAAMPERVLFIPRDGVKKVRFLEELDDAAIVVMHSRWKGNKPVMREQPCLKYYNKTCPFDKDDNYKSNEAYALTVWDYQVEARRVLLLKATEYSPLQNLMDITEESGSLKDRDIKIKRSAKKKSKYTAIALEKSKFEGDKDKPYSKEKVFKILEELIRATEVVKGDDDDEEEDDDDGDDEGED